MVIALPNKDQIAQAVRRLQAGDLVAFPTETVYGLGADARVDGAVAKIYDLKGRPSFNPLIVHVKDRIAAEEFVLFDARARLIADTFWPGPLTLVLPARAGNGIAPSVSAGLHTLGIRVPRHPVAQALLAAFGGPVAAPSANRSGQLSPTAPWHVAQSFGDKAPLILAAGSAEVGLESTILDLSAESPIILRPGAITPEDLAPLLDGVPPEVAHHVVTEGEVAKSPGLLLRHYAPRHPLRLRAVDVAPDEALLAFGSLAFMGVRGGGFARDLPEGQVLNLSEHGDLEEAASHLFQMLHHLDQGPWSAIAVMDIPDIGVGLAINDRLRRAAQSAE